MNWEEKVVEYAEQIEQIIQNGAPKAWELTQTVVQVNAAQELVYGLIGIIFVILYFYGMRWIEKIEYDEFAPAITIGSITLGIMGIGMIVCNLFDVWNYVALFNPEAEIARQVYESLIK